MRSAHVLVVVAGLAILGIAGPASAHPLGNFTVNQYAGVRITASHLTIDYVVDMAELAAISELPAATSDASYATRTCAAAAAAMTVHSKDGRIRLDSHAGPLSFPSGAGGLRTLRLECTFSGRYSGGDVDFHNGAYADRIGWHEIAVGTSDVAPVSRSARLTAYPQTGLEGTADQRDAHIAAVAAAAVAAPSDKAAMGAVERVTRWFTDLTGRPDLTAGMGVLSLMLALVLGAAHALAPGHGKTVMAAYLVGRHGRRRDALSVAGIVTTTHTLGVLVLGVVIAASFAFAPKSLYQWLAVANGLLMAGVGAVLLRRALRSRFHGSDSLDPLRTTDPSNHHAQDDHGHRHPHHHHHHDQPVSRGTILALGFAGGLAPSPSAVVVLLGAAALGRAWFGVLLVVAYGIGMAGALVGIGLVMARFIDRLGELIRRRWMAMAFGAAPVVTAIVITLAGIAVAGHTLMFG